MGTSTESGTPGEWKATHHHEGGIVGWFKSLFGEDESNPDYRDYETAANQGGVIVSVRADDQKMERASDILQDHNPVNINEESATTRSTALPTGANPAIPAANPKTPAANATTTGTSNASANAGRARADANVPQSMNVVQEDLRVGKRSILRGGVRVYSRVTEKPVEENVQLREEHVHVDRQKVNRPATAADLKPGAQQVYEVQEYAEEAVVQKQARVVEEVRVGKDVSERTETVRGTVRRQDVEVENLGNQAASGANYSDDFRQDFQTRYGASGGKYEDYEPAYNYGYQAASDPRYQGRNWDDVESNLRSDYGSRYPNSTWDKMKDSIRYGWNKVTGGAGTQSRSASAKY